MAESKRPPFLARSSSVSLQRAIVKALKEEGIRAWDGTNSYPTLPFVKIGEELTSGKVTSKDTYGKTHNLTLHVWSDYESSLETKALVDFMVDRLVNSPLELEDGFCVVNANLDHVRYTPAANGAYNNYRAYLFLDFEVSDSLVNPR
jgi:hypothetical protein